MSREVTVVRRVDEGEIELLLLNVGEKRTTALAVFADIVVAVDYMDRTEQLGADEGWEPAEVGPGDIVTICVAYGVGHVVVPLEAGLGGEGDVMSVLEFTDLLAHR